MANPYTQVTVSGYNASPPANDNSQVGSNALDWDNHTGKIGDPLKTAIEAVDANVFSALGKRYMNTATNQNTNFSVVVGDEGKLFVTTNAITATLPLAATATAGFNVIFRNADATNNLTIDGASSETINGSTTITVGPGDFAFLQSNGSLWNALLHEDTDTNVELRAADPKQQPTVVNAADTDHDLTMSTGFLIKDALVMDFQSALTKQIDAVWAAGNDAGGRAAAVTLANNQTLYVHALSDATGATLDWGYDTSATATNLLADANVVAAGLTVYKPWFVFKLDGTQNIIPFTIHRDAMGCDLVLYDTEVQSWTSTTFTTAGTTFEDDCPDGVFVGRYLRVGIGKDTNTTDAVVVFQNASATYAALGKSEERFFVPSSITGFAINTLLDSREKIFYSTDSTFAVDTDQSARGFANTLGYTFNRQEL